MVIIDTTEIDYGKLWHFRDDPIIIVIIIIIIIMYNSIILVLIIIIIIAIIRFVLTPSGSCRDNG